MTIQRPRVIKPGDVLENGGTVLEARGNDVEGYVLCIVINPHRTQFASWHYYNRDVVVEGEAGIETVTSAGHYHSTINGAVEDFNRRTGIDWP